MSSPYYLIEKAEEVLLLREMMARQYDLDSQRNGNIKPADPAGRIVPATVPAPAPASLGITKPENFSFQEVEGFFFKKNVSRRAVELENPGSFQQVQPKDGAGNVVQGTALQFNDVNGTSVFFASSGAPESLADQSGKMRSPLQQDSWSKRPLMV